MAGTIAGRLIGRLTDSGITNKLIKDVQNELQPGTSALILLSRSDPERRQKVIDRMQPFNPKILQSDLPLEVEREIEAGLRERQAA